MTIYMIVHNGIIELNHLNMLALKVDLSMGGSVMEQTKPTTQTNK